VRSQPRAPERGIFLFGGETAGWSYLSTVEKLDPTTNLISKLNINSISGRTKTSCTPLKRYGHTSKVFDNQIYLLGGRNATNNELASVEVFDLARSELKCESVPDMTHKRVWLTSEVYGKFLYAIGGYNGTYCLGSIESYDVISGSWHQSSVSMKTPRYSHSSALVNGMLYVFGGSDVGGSYLREGERFDLNANRWCDIPLLPPDSGRFLSSCVAIDDLYILLIGGSDGDNKVSTVQRFDIRANRWDLNHGIRAMNYKRTGHTSNVLEGNVIYTFGGSGENSGLSSVERYDPVANCWQVLQVSLSPARQHHTSCYFFE